jgi:hypothetical protein
MKHSSIRIGLGDFCAGLQIHLLASDWISRALGVRSVRPIESDIYVVFCFPGTSMAACLKPGTQSSARDVREASVLVAGSRLNGEENETILKATINPHGPSDEAAGL